MSNPNPIIISIRSFLKLVFGISDNAEVLRCTIMLKLHTMSIMVYNYVLKLGKGGNN